MLGALLGALKANEPDNFSYYIVQQIAEFDGLFEIFDHFLKFVQTKKIQELYGMTYRQEERISKFIIEKGGYTHYQPKGETNVKKRIRGQILQKLTTHSQIFVQTKQKKMEEWFFEEIHKHASRVNDEEKLFEEFKECSQTLHSQN